MILARQKIFYLLSYALILGTQLYNPRGAESTMEGNLANRLVFLLCGTVAVLNSARILEFYAKHLKKVDVLLISYVLLYFIGLVHLNLGGMSHIGRIIICFYVVPYFFVSQGNSDLVNGYKKFFYLGMLTVCVLCLQAFLYGRIESGRMISFGHANVTSRAFFATWMVLVIFYDMLKNNFRKKVVLVLLIVCSYICLRTLSRQVFLGMVLFIGVAHFYRIKTLNKKSLAILTIGFMVGLFFIFSVHATGVHRRLFSVQSYTLLSNQARWINWQHRVSYTVENHAHLIFNGYDSVEVTGEGRWVDGVRLTAPHNFILQSIAWSGIASTMVFLLFLFTILRSTWRFFICRLTYGFSITVVVLFLAFFDNFFMGTYGPLSYIFYISAGITINQFRLKKYRYLQRDALSDMSYKQSNVV
jgi:hypothetical protein